MSFFSRVRVSAPRRRVTAPLVLSIAGLPEKQRTALHLYYYEGYSIKEIAKTLGLPAATVGTRLARGRERLRQMLKEDV